MISLSTTATYDVVVVGGGAAGVAAAVSAARAGASVCLIEHYGFLGGAATNSSVLAYCGFFDQTREQVVRGIGQDFLDELERQELLHFETSPATGNTIVVLDLETTKSVLDQLVRSAGVDVLFHSTLVAADTDAGGISAVQVVHRGGNLRLSGTAFVDCSGDGALLQAAGAEFQLSPTERRQASTLVMRVGGVGEDADLSTAAMDDAFAAYGKTTGEILTRSNGTCVRMPRSRELMLLLADEYVDVLDVHEISRAEQDGRVKARHYLEALKAGMRGWSGAYLASTGPQIGIREARRMQGRESVTADDVLTARRRPADGIARCGWPMEDHATPGATTYSGIKDRKWYDIPYGAVTSANITNLWGAGRLTSSDSRSFASLRVMGTSFATGHAAGLAASLHSSTGSVDVSKLRGLLQDQGALL
ncbi:FAD-dependent oxidoreductase [Arthrobacter sp. zg-Y844]|uniref:FAD-dependent oxidoreductase n=1 Tax=Arthrobacter sp. zg-Y844 TaxID=2964612 RepID=UPI0021081906|nr:FAD-dependent oxidoreductase [Arthrobacter sp. zg-Y844]MCQ1987506.1 FAD-dependent oxidoreductase [Arthrobacter sp. zg-Y844]